ARSTVLSLSHDFSCFVSDADGAIISQADGCPIHTGCGGLSVKALLAAFPDDVNEGDVFLMNDPYVAGGNHLADWVVVHPAFHDEQRIGFTCNRAHQSDIGGGAAGTFNPKATEIWHEGIRLPPLKLYRRGEVCEDLWQLLLLNCRTPDLIEGDLRAMVGSTEIGKDRLEAIARDLGVDQAHACFRGILDHGER
ncbi:MAG: hydantoinase B/oxoprolinase family protein, partial [Alphaproteobacteria bacterium]